MKYLKNSTFSLMSATILNSTNKMGMPAPNARDVFVSLNMQDDKKLISKIYFRTRKTGSYQHDSYGITSYHIQREDIY